MDDYLDSFDVPEEAIRVGRCVKEILRKGDFNLTKWISNSGEVRRAFGKEKNDGILTSQEKKRRNQVVWSSMDPRSRCINVQDQQYPERDP